MVKVYNDVTQIKEDKIGPKNDTLNALLNYSKSLKVKKVNGEKMMIHLN